MTGDENYIFFVNFLLILLKIEDIYYIIYTVLL